MLVLSITAVSCSGQKPGIEKFKWLTGTWVNHSNQSPLFETWEFINDTLMTGRSYIIKGNDSSFFEKISLVRRGTDFFYIPVVTGQNNGLPVPFKLTSGDGYSFIFENPTHDFPQTVMYRYISADSIFAQVSGREHNVYRAEAFPMSRNK